MLVLSRVRKLSTRRVHNLFDILLILRLFAEIVNANHDDDYGDNAGKRAPEPNKAILVFFLETDHHAVFLTASA